MNVIKLLNPTIFVNYMHLCRSYIRSEVSLKYLAAILDAILDFSKCSRVTGCHTADSERGHLPEHFDTKTFYAYTKVRYSPLAPRLSHKLS